MPNPEIIQAALKQIFAGISRLKAALPNKEFTIDGRLVGDIGEAIAQRDYDLTLYSGLARDYDGYTACGRQVQIKATFKDSLTFRKTPDYYLGIKIYDDGSYKEIFNGPGRIIADAFSHRKGLGVDLLSFSNKKLEELSRSVMSADRIPRR